jgi:GDP-D-mannose dehydratase
MIRKSALPDGELRAQPVRKASFDEPHGVFDRNALGSKQKVNVIRHDDKRVQLIVALAAVLLQRLQK